jgi:hypothetical protein
MLLKMTFLLAEKSKVFKIDRLFRGCNRINESYF